MTAALERLQPCHKSDLKQNGKTLVQLMALGGWKSFAMVQRYAHFNTHHLVAPAKNVERAQEDTPPPSTPSSGSRRAVPYLRVVRCGHKSGTSALNRVSVVVEESTTSGCF